MRLLATTIGLLAFALAGAAPASAQAPAPLATLKADDTFFDDAFAVDPAGERLAVIRTDGADVCRLEVIEIATQQKVLSADLVPLSRTPERVQFSPDGRRVLVVAPATAGSNGVPARTAQVFDLGGKHGKKLGPATDFALSMVSGKPRVITFDARPAGDGGTSFRVVASTLEQGASAGSRTLKVVAGGALAGKGPELKPVAWLDGYTTLLATQRGDYDKAQDARRPDAAALYDVLRGRIAQTREIRDLVAWVKVAPLREQRPNQPWFVLPSEDLRQLELLRADDSRVPIQLARPLKHYDLDSLRQRLVPETGAPQQLYFAMSVDPVNADAVAQKTYHPDDYDVYALDLKAAAPAPRRVLVLPGDKREKRSSVFAAGGGKLAVLRKHKMLERGGNEIRIFAVP